MPAELAKLATMPSTEALSPTERLEFDRLVDDLRRVALGSRIAQAGAARSTGEMAQY
jgi:hypothetical protein